MPWEEVTKMSLKREFVMLALKNDANVASLCRRFGISRKTGYKWLQRYFNDGDKGLYDLSRRPYNSPNKTTGDIEKRILELRDDHPEWGGRKIHVRLQDLGINTVPPSSTINAILKRNNRIQKEESLTHKAMINFEAEKPNDIWQMDYKGWFKVKNGQCHPLTV